MKIIVGLGNPGKKYEHNRHNAGFLAVDFLMGDWEPALGNFKENFHVHIWEGAVGPEKIFLCKPQTFMNGSGQAVRELAHFYKLDPSRDIVVLHDEVDLPFGTIRLTGSSSSAGQNGVQNIIDELGTQDFHRIRIGVETRESRAEIATKDFVLQDFTADELKRLQGEIFPKVKETVRQFLLNTPVN